MAAERRLASLFPWTRGLLVCGALMGASGVGLAAMAAHMAGGATLMTAAQFLLFHAVMVVALVAVAPQFARGQYQLIVAACIFVLGAVMFSGSLALSTLLDVHLGIAPGGGTFLIFGWLYVAYAAFVGTSKAP